MAEVVEDLAGEASAPGRRINRQVEHFQNIDAGNDYRKRPCFSLDASDQKQRPIAGKSRFNTGQLVLEHRDRRESVAARSSTSPDPCSVSRGCVSSLLAYNWQW